MQTNKSCAGEQGILSTTWHRLLHEEEGQTLVEYGLMISLIALVAVVTVRVFGRGVNDNLYGNANTKLNNLPTS